MSKVLFSLFVILFSFAADASFLVMKFGVAPADRNQEASILIAGRGKELGYLLQDAAVTKAHKLQELFPSRQIIFITVAETGVGENKSYLYQKGFQPISDMSSDFTPDQLLSELLKWKKIASIDFYAHNSAHLGMQLQDADTRFPITYSKFSQLKPNLSPDAYVMLQGCSTGFWMAPNMSKWLGVPVAGSLTGTNVHRLHSNGFFVDNDEPKKPEGPWAENNNQSFQMPIACDHGGCIRMKPDNDVYAGTWGRFSGGGLPFYKFFCADGNQSQCQKAMARSLYSFPSVRSISLSSSKDEFTDVLNDFFCPISKDISTRQSCLNNLNAALQSNNDSYSPYRGRQLKCNYQKCEFDIDCSSFFGKIIPGTCDLYNPNKTATTFMNEYRDYLMGYDLIHK